MLSQPFEPVACALGQLVQKEHPTVRQRDLGGYGKLGTADKGQIGDGLVGP